MTVEQFARSCIVFRGLDSSVLNHFAAASNCPRMRGFLQTGSGKTHTMEGTPRDRGVNFRTLADLFAVIEERQVESVYSVTVSALEVHLRYHIQHSRP